MFTLPQSWNKCLVVPRLKVSSLLQIYDEDSWVPINRLPVREQLTTKAVVGSWVDDGLGSIYFFSKVFDVVNYAVLLGKFESFGIRDPLPGWIYCISFQSCNECLCRWWLQPFC